MWALIHDDWCPYREEIWKQNQTCREGAQCEETHVEDSREQAKERGLEQILPSQPSEGTNPALGISDF